MDLTSMGNRKRYKTGNTCDREWKGQSAGCKFEGDGCWVASKA